MQSVCHDPWLWQLKGRGLKGMEKESRPMVRAANDVKNESWSNEGSEEAQAGAVRGSAWGMMSRVSLSSGNCHLTGQMSTQMWG